MPMTTLKTTPEQRVKLIEQIEQQILENEYSQIGHDLLDDLDTLAMENERLRLAVSWALGEEGSDFEPRKEGEPPFWWRKRLSQLAKGERP